MRLTIKELCASSDADFARDAFDRCADYVWLETGQAPNAETLTEFFDDHPPSKTTQDKLLLGLIDDQAKSAGLVEVIRGYPEATDWYLGLLVIAPDLRGQGAGKQALDWVVQAAKAAGATRLLLCVLDENPRAQAFWMREGFVFKQKTPPWTSGQKTHIRYELMRML